MTTISREELERAVLNQQREIEYLKREFNEFKDWVRDWVNKRLDLRADITQQNAIAIQTLSIRMDRAGLPK